MSIEVIEEFWAIAQAAIKITLDLAPLLQTRE